MKLFVLGLTIAAALACANVTAQQATEVYIPIGDSPGVSKDRSWIGEIRNVDYDVMRLEVDTSRGMRQISVDARTRFYLDRTRYRKQNATGTMRDCRIGRRIEAYVGEGGKAYWIKIEAD